MLSQIRLLLCSTALLCAAPARADFVVIANPRSGVEQLSKDDIINIYMGRYRKLPSGISATPVDLSNPVDEKARFYAYMVKKELAEINSYWARLMFSGQNSRPLQAENSDEVLEIVSNNKGAIGYIDKKKLDKRVKLVFDPSP